MSCPHLEVLISTLVSFENFCNAGAAQGQRGGKSGEAGAGGRVAAGGMVESLCWAGHGLVVGGSSRSGEKEQGCGWRWSGVVEGRVELVEGSEQGLDGEYGEARATGRGALRHTRRTPPRR